MVYLKSMEIFLDAKTYYQATIFTSNITQSRKSSKHYLAYLIYHKDSTLVKQRKHELIFKKVDTVRNEKAKPSMTAPICNHSTQEAETGKPTVWTTQVMQD